MKSYEPIFMIFGGHDPGMNLLNFDGDPEENRYAYQAILQLE